MFRKIAITAAALIAISGIGVAASTTAQAAPNLVVKVGFWGGGHGHYGGYGRLGHRWGRGHRRWFRHCHPRWRHNFRRAYCHSHRR